MIRVFNILVSGLSLFLLSPALVPVIIVLRFTGEGEVLYKQKRIGKDQNPFYLFKFATMLKNSENIGAGSLTMRNDPRVLPLGRILRKTKINELPQLINILLGDMNIVGPRPLVPEGEGHYPNQVSVKLRSISPGVTGIGSIMLRDEESYYAHRKDARDFYKNVISPYKGSVELWYIENRSFALDIKIIALTVGVILFRHNNTEKFFQGLPKMPTEMKSSQLEN